MKYSSRQPPSDYHLDQPVLASPPSIERNTKNLNGRHHHHDDYAELSALNQRERKTKNSNSRRRHDDDYAELRALNQRERKTKNSNGRHRHDDEYAELRALNQFSKKNSSLTKSTAKSVQFDTVQILFYPRILGDNPCCMGAPLSLDWQPFHQEMARVEQYERVRQRRPEVSKLSRKERRDIILNSGTTQQELDAVNAYLEPSRKEMLANISRKDKLLAGYQHRPKSVKIQKKILPPAIFVDASGGGLWHGQNQRVNSIRTNYRGDGTEDMDC